MADWAAARDGVRLRSSRASGGLPHVNKLTVAEITTAGKGYPSEVAIGQNRC
jgi:hypothetical protein